MTQKYYTKTKTEGPNFSSYSLFWRKSVVRMAARLLDVLGQDRALDLVHDMAHRDGWSDEYRYLVLRLLKPDAPIGQEASA